MALPITDETVMDRSEAEKDLAALESMRRARLNFERRVCQASATQDDAILEALRLDSMFEFAEFFFALRVMDFTAPDDIGLLAEAHNQRIIDLEKNPLEMRRRRLTKDRLLKAMFTADTLPRLESCWREVPGSLDQSNLARFLAPQMSPETTRKLASACAAAGFLKRRDNEFGTVIVITTGVMEGVFSQCMREMREEISRLYMAGQPGDGDPRGS
jgi:hypothetical protein